MKAEVKARWVERLRSGEIVQGVGRLGGVEGERCCLGVLCDIAVEAGVIDPPTVMEDDTLRYANATNYLPAEVIMWAELSDGNPVPLSGPAALTSLSTMNDAGDPFTVIADAIEQGL